MFSVLCGGSNVNTQGGLQRYAGSLIICLGNSLTRGFGASDPLVYSYPAQLQTYFNTHGIAGVTVMNAGVDGAASNDLNSSAQTSVDPYYDSNRQCILLYNEIGNYVYLGYGDAAGAIANSAFCLNNRNAGWNKIWLGCADRGLDPSIVSGLTPGGQTRTQYRATMATAQGLMVAGGWSPSARSFCNLLANPNLADYSNLTYFLSDQTHNHDAGYGQYTLSVLNHLASL